MAITIDLTDPAMMSPSHRRRRRRQLLALERGGNYRPSSYKRLSVKQKLIERDGNYCQACGDKDARLTIDHRWPKSRGGSNTLANYWLFCHTCNGSKGDMRVDEWVKAELAPPLITRRYWKGAFDLGVVD